MFRRLVVSAVLLSFILRTALAGQFSGAVWVAQPDLTAATQAVCPATAPISCSTLAQPDYCCPAGNYCAYASDNAVGCCPWGQTCSGAIGGAQQTIWVPTTTAWQQSTVHVTTAVPTTTVYGGIVVPGVVSTTTQHVQTVTTAQQSQSLYYGGYCSTLYAHGPDLPTTRQGTCGTILVLNSGTRISISMMFLTVLAATFQLLW